MVNKRTLGFWLGPLVALVIWLGVSPEGLSQEGVAVLAGTCWMAIWWMTEAVPIAATALLPLILFPLSGAVELSPLSKTYISPILFLFIGGFMLALAMAKWNLHKRIALGIISLVGADANRLVLGFMLATAFLSMWISNTATTLMMVPIAGAVIDQFDHLGFTGAQDSGKMKLGAALMISIAYAASIGGMATLVGTPTNLIFTGYVKEAYGLDVPFGQWMMMGIPVSVILLTVAWYSLTHWVFPLGSIKVPGARAEIRRQLKDLGPMKYQEGVVLAVFVTVAICWIIRSYVLKHFIPGIHDAMIGLVGALILFSVPSGHGPGKRILDWDTAVKLPWGILLLFGGAFAIAFAFEQSGLAAWLAGQFSGLAGAPYIVILMVIVLSVVFLTEITQNMATCTLMMPVMAALAPNLGVDPYALMIPVAFASSAAFMLPVATAPNAIVFGTGQFEMRDMIRAGFWLNLISAGVIVAICYWGMSVVWGV
ncbi:DASS family sodium-coupled anion symporter [Pontibacter sp. G13]|uniref:SLC13 family permease n=1 Tax=Pontibacter sp. G13 TaxID=3074898 RepID=UPI00288A353F|nr:DASS family sodium-coupled anion symporter [Pontibacter sp. G13]WNJ19380.1 DASS family sodium-coupled anion symporter [Pontibacter sp. G13]